MWIQILLIIAIVAIGVLFLRRPGGERHLALRRLGLLLFIAVAVVSVLFPAWLSWLAQLVGVGRGTDLLLYAFVVVFLTFVLSHRRRAIEQDRKITALARAVALSDAHTRADSAPARPTDDAGR